MSETTPVAEIDLSVVLPAHNEVTLLGSTVTNIVSGLEQRNVSFEILIVENGSSDGTLRLARVLAAQIPEVRVLAHGRGNYGAALASGIETARGRLVATFDVDYYDLTFLDDAVQLIEAKGAGIVVASKRAPGAQDRRPILRRTLTFGFTLLLQRLLGLEVSDAHGMKLLRRELVRPLLDETVLRDGLFDVELVVRAERVGIQVCELPASVVERRPPRTSVAHRAATTLLDLARLRLILGPGAPRGSRPEIRVQKGLSRLSGLARSISRRVRKSGPR